METLIIPLMKEIDLFIVVVLAVAVLIFNNKKLEQTIHKLEQRIEKLEGKIDAMHEDFLTKEEHYRDISGWRGEMHRLEDKIERLIEKVMEVKK